MRPDSWFCPPKMVTPAGPTAVHWSLETPAVGSWVKMRKWGVDWSPTASPRPSVELALGRLRVQRFSVPLWVPSFLTDSVQAPLPPNWLNAPLKADRGCCGLKIPEMGVPAVWIGELAKSSRIASLIFACGLLPKTPTLVNRGTIVPSGAVSQA